MKKITVARALVEVKTLEKRIEKKIKELNLLGVKSKSVNLVKGTTLSSDEFVDQGRSEFTSVLNLIKNRDELKRKIIMSNATTKVSLNGKEYTVAEMIEKKNSIEFEQMLLATLKNQKLNVEKMLQMENQKVESDAQRLKDMYIGSSKEGNKNLVEQADGVYKSHIQNNEYVMIDSVDVSEKIDKLGSEVEDFLAEVDFLLSESNARTEIEVQG